ncbi:Crp/Fnr family transcriptional regulator [Gemmatimonas sp.]|jgi:CRP/FNR family cyclic AMP-dependent transcriptional regulator|uniref:Crp/Fnr family transcriptional regulator n=2 Tax=Gemmatimonas sp. TaxID=1962908 RepID=UPI0022CC1733|nr:Crp/Fnr family transcriptional regulator [Gemmatimonas sp.]MCA2986508.1 Crp/Fnr family transcriptional regulator [Gemmatimonas sp.]MCA2991077.1 Crp/Fnr family transcriptional regulator [Gemmatimonas sp.]MCE2952262.1 Crp/Fnr family transcriptional regulator [Gemmatimonas sp.]MCZ8268168.1 Crp/Fnr family transcriptional regulator [Gemmatimonas sp.]
MVTFRMPPMRYAPSTMSVSLDRITDFLSTVPLFRELDRAAVRGFAEYTRERKFSKGAMIVAEGDPGDALFVVRSGEVKVVLAGEDGRDVILNVLNVGDHFGELALIDGRPRSAHVIATQASSLLTLSRADFRRQVEQSPQVAWGLMVELSRRLRQADGTIGSLVLLDVPGRVAKVLLEHATPGEPATLVKQLTHQVIAQMIGASRETVSRAMAEFQEKGIISVQRRIVTITDRTALEARARPRL